MSLREPLRGQPTDADGTPVFAAPWQAKAFALVVHLHDRGVFCWPDWAAALARACERQEPGPDGYYTAWVEALGTVLSERGIAGDDEVTATAEAWARPAETTPHGKPILLKAGMGVQGNSLTTNWSKDISCKTTDEWMHEQSVRAALEASFQQDGPLAEAPSEPAEPAPTYGAKNKLVTQERHAELVALLREKLRDQLNSGIDPKILAIGIELEMFHIEAGVRKLMDFAKAVADDLGANPAKLRSYLRACYNALMQCWSTGVRVRKAWMTQRR